VGDSKSSGASHQSVGSPELLMTKSE